MKKVAIHQSQYLPWAPYFRKVAQSDKFVIMDSVQFQKNGVQNRNKIRNKKEDFWLTIPVSGKIDSLISEKIISSPIWKKKHWKSIKTAYQKAPNWHLYADDLEYLYMQEYVTLFEANEAFFKFFLERLEIDTDIVYMSNLNTKSAKSDLVLEICQKVNADKYISGYGGKNYLDEVSFIREGISIDYTKTALPEYPQLHEGFISGLSILDMIMNVNIYEVRRYLYD